MIVQDRITIDAPIEAVWAVYTDVERWPSWTASVTRLELLDAATLGPGVRARIDQPRFPSLVWQVDAWSPGTAWSWTTHRPGATTTARHELEAQRDGRTLVTQTIEQRGALGVVVGLLTARLTRRYLAMEAAGLAARVAAGVPSP